jgi:hypothetical protein
MSGATGSRWPRLLGIALQALVLGTLLFLALVNLIAMGEGARIFRYQNF